ncbi:CBS domain-containing protein [Alteromonas sp. 14N.309.X.WAT.G.H12]|uniref:CBS domain-containing protein n=1 Tax=Alteromonas sp. 14N.309.X.WAT.G.H12 TaxID=3120824 RepID=UPI002FD22707
MGVNEIMSQRVVSVQMDDSLHTLKELFEATGFHHLLVVENKKLVGVISDRDLLKSLSPFTDTLSERLKDRATLERRAHQIMSRDIVAIQEHSSIMKAIAFFNRRRVSCLPVLNQAGEPVGIVSWRDILRYIEEKVLKKQRIT